MEISFSEYHDLISRVEELERNSLADNALFVPVCVAGLGLAILAIFAALLIYLFKKE